MDRGLLYGDGLFETMLVRGGRIRFESDHRARLAEGCRRLDIRVDLARVWQDTLQAAARHREASLRLQVTRGQALARGYAPGAGEVPSTFLAVFPPPSPRELPSPIRLVTLQLRLGENPLLAGLKHCNRLEQVLARRELAGTVGACEGLLGSSSGLLISGTMSNVFLQLDGELVTPALTRCGVAGVLRTALLREAEHAGTPVRVADIDLAALSRCTSAAISNARLGLLPAHELDGRQLEGCERINALAARIAAA
jgi:4-amino-4-deoxychorismate lyase